MGDDGVKTCRNEMHKKFKEVLEIRNGKNQKTVENPNGQYPIYGSGGAMGYADDYICEGNTIIIGRKGSINNPIFVDRPFWNVDTAFGLVPKKEIILPKYLFYFCKNFNFERLNTTVTIPSLTKANLLNIEINVPTIMEQEIIIKKIEKIESIIKYRKQQLEALDTLIKAQFVEMFGDPDTNQLGWKKAVLAEHLTVVGGYAFKSGGFVDSGTPVLRIGNINSGHFSPVNIVYWKKDLSLEKYKMYPGDLVMSLTGTVGKDDYGNVCILGNEYPEYYLNQRNAKLELQPTLNKYYLSELLKFSKIKKQLTGISRGIRQANISNKDILCLDIPIPPIELQTKFAAFVTQVDKSKVAVQKSLNETQLLFDSLMQRYFG